MHLSDTEMFSLSTLTTTTMTEAPFSELQCSAGGKEVKDTVQTSVRTEAMLSAHHWRAGTELSSPADSNKWDNTTSSHDQGIPSYTQWKDSGIFIGIYYV